VKAVFIGLDLLSVQLSNSRENHNISSLLHFQRKVGSYFQLDYIDRQNRFIGGKRPGAVFVVLEETMLEIEHHGWSEEVPLRKSADPIAVAAGTIGVIATGALLLALPIIAEAAVEPPAPERDAEPMEYVEARLLKLGEIKDEKALPDRVVPPQPTAPEEVLPLDRDEDRPEPPEEPEKKPERQPDAVSDNELRKVFEKARAFAEIQDDYTPEGHPDGVPDGEVTDPSLASIGATYGHRIKRIFLERWIVPTLLSESQLEGLRVKVNLRVDIEMVITDIEYLKESNSEIFNDSVKNAIERVREEVRTLPDPPEAIASRIFGGGINITFNGEEASYE
jgi:hypothetical protein